MKDRLKKLVEKILGYKTFLLLITILLTIFKILAPWMCFSMIAYLAGMRELNKILGR
jgi:hypothetical protein